MCYLLYVHSPNASLSVIFRTDVQHVTRFQLTCM